jgi:hypothetical protein
MQQARADLLLGVNGDRHDSLGFRIPELPVAPLPRSQLFEPVLPEQPNQFRPRHSSSCWNRTLGLSRAGRSGVDEAEVIASTRAAEDKPKISASACERWLVQTQWFKTEPKANPNSALDGVLRLEPDLRPYSAQFENFVKLKTNDSELHTQLLKWEHVNVGHSWRYVRLIVIGLVAGLGVFLTVTQPAPQSSLLGIAVALTGALTTAFKLRDAITSWFANRKSPA